MSRTANNLLFLAHTQPGFEDIAALQLVDQLEGVRIRKTFSVEQKNGMVLFEYQGPAEDLLSIRTLEDLFLVVAHLTSLPATRPALALLEQAAARAKALPAGLALLRRLWPARPVSGKLRYRVIARQSDKAAYRRVDAQHAVERGIASRGDHKWRLDPEGGVEFWLNLVAGEAYLALRLSDVQMRHREYKTRHLPASLRPSAAAALAFLTDPQPDDIFLDPMCGAGTLLIERAHLERYQQLLGGDMREEALEVARANVGPRYKPIELRLWDARSLPLDAGSVSAIAVNLPFGRQIGSALDNRLLYPAFLVEAARVLRPGARLVTLTGDVRTLLSAADRSSALARRQQFRVQLLGRPAAVHVFERR